MRRYRFWFHYNKPASLKAGRNKLTVHYRDTCYLVDGIECTVPIGSVDRKTQPRCIMAGYANSFSIGHSNIGYIS